ncbi:MAG TPA: FIST N-terminal domain-containing protein [Chitinophagaceae bacterium]|nr:FIST C-terminal domain-containing protein [Chitinophagales bacterium]HPG11176.1 FIST N-terminal domain-containing protein [Chitinophagaceae bacterium]
MKAKSIKGKNAEELKTALQQSMNDGFKPTLAFVFLTEGEDIDAITAMLDGQSIAIFGASTSEKFTEHGLEPDAIVALLLDMDTAHFKIVLKEFNDVASVYETACEVGESGKNSFDHPAFIISTADIRIPGEELIRGILDKAGIDVPVIGARVGEHINFTGTVFTNQLKSNSAIISMIVDEDKIDVKGVAVSGWKPVGTEKKVTKSEGNWVFAIDGEPAMDVIKKFLGTDMLTSYKSEGLDSYPLQFQRGRGKPVMNPIILWNKENQSVMLGAPVAEGSIFRFSLPPDLEVIDTVIDSTKTIKENELPDVDAMLIFSCVGRLSSLGPMVNSEIEGLAATWNKPMAGFFSLGEFGKLDDTPPEFHGTTVSWVVFKEK